MPQRVSITSATTLNLGLLPGKHAEVEALLGKSRQRPQPASPEKQQRPSPGKAPPERLSLQAQQLQKFGATPDEASQLLTSLDGVDAEVTRREGTEWFSPFPLAGAPRGAFLVRRSPSGKSCTAAARAAGRGRDGQEMKAALDGFGRVNRLAAGGGRADAHQRRGRRRFSNGEV